MSAACRSLPDDGGAAALVSKNTGLDGNFAPSTDHVPIAAAILAEVDDERVRVGEV